MARGDLTDEQWALVEPHLPLGASGPIPDLRKQFNGAMWRFRSAVLADLPPEYGSWSTAMTVSAPGRGRVSCGV